jgi:hypothetical protein
VGDCDGRTDPRYVPRATALLFSFPPSNLHPPPPTKKTKTKTKTKTSQPTNQPTNKNQQPTKNREVRELARAGLRNPATIAVQVRDAATRAVQATPQNLRNFYVVVRRHEEKLALLLEFLKVWGEWVGVGVGGCGGVWNGWKGWGVSLFFGGGFGCVG